MNQKTALLGLITETSLHAGAGSSVGAVDLPIQREGHNGWPCVFGSAVKGGLRALGESVLGRGDRDLLAVFGPDTKNASEHAGAIAIGDARLLLLPVRSLTSSFKWVTCPEALLRLERDAERLGLEEQLSFSVPQVDGHDAKVVRSTGDLFLEEYRFTEAADDRVAEIAKVLTRLMRRKDAEVELLRRLVIVSDDLFSHLTQAATQVNAHIALDSTTKTVSSHALWYEESLAPETLLYAPVVAVNARQKDSQLDALAVLGKLKGLFADKPWLQLGGNETVGMGWCAVTLVEG